ncbi:hypothetical protein SPONN_997 [uncultured Candidatus Thioglobus sp.]|nr:hypothetical protein SPONN_997 [uncultured Candidatus Thioglobus sp.]
MDRIIKVRDFSKTPGTRHTAEGLFSGEDFRKVIDPEFKKAFNDHVQLTVDLDNTIGYGTSWLEEVFGGLARSEGAQKVTDTLRFVSDEEPYLIDDIKGYIKDAEQQTH